ncbi:MAG TPA: tRNA dihydrouridine synthase DusB [Planctomycetaceae bacterium]|nr:tRNA dihydrouridine synthase DusB [Planctomycetaceae bacterium]
MSLSTDISEPVFADGRYHYPQPAAMPPISFGSLKLPTRFCLSPLAKYTNLSFRRVVRECGGLGMGTCDLVNARALLAGSHKSMALIRTCPEDTPFAVQIFGSEPKYMRDAVQYLESLPGIDAIDINMGCPVDHVTNNGAGARMMCSLQQTVSLVQTIVEAVSLPVTVKMRLGWDETQLTAPKFAREFEQVGIKAVAIHGRTRAQGFKGSVDLSGIRRVVEAVESIPVIGNGDIRSIPDAARMFERTGCSAISVGRGALANPWIFHQLQQWEEFGSYDPPGNFNQRLDLVLQQFGYLEELDGPESALIAYRRTVHWYLKAMRVPAKLREGVQKSKTRSEFLAAMDAVREQGPIEGSRTGILPELQVPVPAGPVERW